MNSDINPNGETVKPELDCRLPIEAECFLAGLYAASSELRDLVRKERPFASPEARRFITAAAGTNGKDAVLALRELIGVDQGETYEEVVRHCGWTAMCDRARRAIHHRVSNMCDYASKSLEAIRSGRLAAVVDTIPESLRRDFELTSEGEAMSERNGT